MDRTDVVDRGWGELWIDFSKSRVPWRWREVCPVVLDVSGESCKTAMMRSGWLLRSLQSTYATDEKNGPNGCLFGQRHGMSTTSMPGRFH